MICFNIDRWQNNAVFAYLKKLDVEAQYTLIHGFITTYIMAEILLICLKYIFEWQIYLPNLREIIVS